MSLGRIAKLNTGATIPLVGLGTYQGGEDAIKIALQTGYRHFDTAWVYGTEKDVGDAIRESNVPREEIFITTKLWNTSHRPQDVLPALETSLKNLRMDYVDLYLMHWPIAYKAGPDPTPRDSEGNILFEDIDITETYKAMEDLVATGKAKAIGVSNFTIKNLEKLLKVAKIVPAVNQVELHPDKPQWELMEYCNSKNIHLTAYSPLGTSRSNLITRDEITKIAEKHNSSSASVLISWAAQRGASVVPKSATESRIVSNFKDIVLDEEDLKVLKGLAEGKPSRSYWDSTAILGVDVFN